MANKLIKVSNNLMRTFYLKSARTSTKLTKPCNNVKHDIIVYTIQKKKKQQKKKRHSEPPRFTQFPKDNKAKR